MPVFLRRLEAERLQPGEQLDLRWRHPSAFHFAGAVENDVELAPGDEAGVELFERAGGGVARVGEGFFAGRSALDIDFGEHFLREVNFAAHFQQSRTGVPLVTGRREACPTLESQGQTANRFQIRGDVVASRAVAARGADGENPGLVPETDRHAVDLRLNAPVELFVGNELLSPFDELPHFVLRISVVEAHHRDEVL